MRAIGGRGWRSKGRGVWYEEDEPPPGSPGGGRGVTRSVVPYYRLGSRPVSRPAAGSDSDA